MNIIFFTQEDPFYVKIFFDEFFKHYKPIHEIKAIVISKPMGKQSVIKLARQMYNFYGFYYFFKTGLKYVYIKLMAKKPVGRIKSGIVPKTYTLKQLAKTYNINVIERSDLNSKDFLSFIKQYDADLFISVASPVIFKEDLITIPKLNCINIHNAPLPNYRGMLPSFWQMYHDEKEAGITIHQIEKGIDTGDIITQHFVPIEYGETLNNLMIKTKKKNAWMIMDIIEDFRNGMIQYKKMEGKGSYFTFPSRKDAKEFRKRGKYIL